MRFKSVVYYGEARLGALETLTVKDQNFVFPNNEIRIHHISQNSERCRPLAVFQAISSPVRCKLEPSSDSSNVSTAEQSPLINLHSSCFYDLKTAVVLLGDEEVHLVAMPSKQKKFPCFWCFSVPRGLYGSCLGMLNMRCLSIVFDLDETLVVANTMRSFENRIEALRGWTARETDPIRVLGMSAEMKRYTEDRVLLKQYIEGDSVVDGNKVYKAVQEEVPQLSDGHECILRPVIRLQEKNIVLTRINPENRDTSVLVRLRPAWDDLKTYLTAKGRKRFEVYVCTMAERDYALEMWRLLDPEAQLICTKQLVDRIVCVKSVARKSLLNVFQGGICHPKLAMVIDDRLKVWEDMDRPHVHVVPPFVPYYAPQAETGNVVPVLCVARNVACDVRSRFFKELDESLLQNTANISYEDEVVNLPSGPDVSHYLAFEDSSFLSNGSFNPPIPKGMFGPAVAQRLDQQDGKNNMNPATPLMPLNPVLKSEHSQSVLGSAPNLSGSLPIKGEPSLLGVPFRRDNSISETDRDGRKRVRHQGSAEPPLVSRVPQNIPVLPLQTLGSCLIEDDTNRGHFGSQTRGLIQDFGAFGPDKQGLLPLHVSATKSEEKISMHKKNVPNPVTDIVSQNQLPSGNIDFQLEGGKMNILPSIAIGVLQEIGRRCTSKVEFRPGVSTSAELQFSVEVFFTGEKIGVGMGKTIKDAQQQAAANALRSLADKYMFHVESYNGVVDKDFDNHSVENENGFLWDSLNLEDKKLADGKLVKVNGSEVGL
ncbi:PREDICTED: RNA polymerase II C-terminal domain phosphatase-like 2 isoform X2 [Ipomoea nil]|uniref:RNA polymerase II C-terminal domain phosphatase-like 2 isoform X2 n=1 Tax=Ipomoea nil TaxID=35883 RepID=UPI000901FDE5|nr:PREDICTED: RNA polymerase II C-terminal domain phosphatase-like 2 isoform X2 [Ipomoea nil]